MILEMSSNVTKRPLDQLIVKPKFIYFPRRMPFCNLSEKANFGCFVGFYPKSC